MDQMIKQEDAYDPLLSQMHKLNINKSNIQKTWNSGHWSEEQNMKCIAYFQFNKTHLHSKLKMKENKFFKQMSIFVDSRSPIQCRSQCQKLLRKYKTFYNIINSFKNQYDEEKYYQQYQQYIKNPLIRFKGSIEMLTFEKHAENAKEISIQTDKSYLLKKSMTRDNRRQTQQDQNQANQLHQFPFLKAGWWL